MIALVSQVLLLLVACSLARNICPETNQIRCRNSSRCTSIRYICDGDNDCGDNSDEDSTLCRYWHPDPYTCQRGSVKCTRIGRSGLSPVRRSWPIRDPMRGHWLSLYTTRGPLSGCIPISLYCDSSDLLCEGSVDARICQMLRDNIIQDIASMDVYVITESTPVITTEVTTTEVTTSEVTTAPSVFFSTEDIIEGFQQKLDVTIRHKDCPQLYTRIGDHCVSVFFPGNLTWLESKAFCEAIGGELFTVKPDFSNYIALLKHFHDNQVTKDFWIDGAYVNETTGWQWTDGRSIHLGSPLWAVRHNPTCAGRSVISSSSNITREANDGFCYHYTQAPSTPHFGGCLAVTYEHYYHGSDQQCWDKKSPLCVAPDEHPKQAI